MKNRRVKNKTKAVLDRASLITALDKTVKDIARTLWGNRCVVYMCDATGKMDIHHWHTTVGAGRMATRWNLINMIPMCRRHHDLVHRRKTVIFDLPVLWLNDAAEYLDALKIRMAGEHWGRDDLKARLDAARRVLAVAKKCGPAMFKSYIERFGKMPYFVE